MFWSRLRNRWSRICLQASVLRKYGKVEKLGIVFSPYEKLPITFTQVSLNDYQKYLLRFHLIVTLRLFKKCPRKCWSQNITCKIVTIFSFILKLPRILQFHFYAHWNRQNIFVLWCFHLKRKIVDSIFLGTRWVSKKGKASRFSVFNGGNWLFPISGTDTCF